MRVHRTLEITANEEALWNGVAQAMREKSAASPAKFPSLLPVRAAQRGFGLLGAESRSRDPNQHVR